MPASVIPVTGLNLGPVGAVSQSDFPLRTPRQVNPSDIYSIAFGEPAVLNPNNTYSSVKQFVLGGDFVVATTLTATSSSAVIAVTSVAGIVAGQVAVGVGIPAATTVVSIASLNVTLSASTTAASGATVSFYSGAGTLVHGAALGIAAANTRTNPTFPMAGTQGVVTPGGLFAPGVVADVMTQGTMNIQVNNGTPTAGGLVYIRVILNGAIPAGVVGGFEAVADSSNTVVIDCMKFKTGILGTDGTAQVTIPTRVLP